MSRVLLDTHVFFWALAEPSRLPRSAWTILNDPELSLELSIASAWELTIKHGIEKIMLPGSASDFVADGCREAKVDLLGIDLAHLQELGRLPFHHRDPFDRMIIAQARSEGIPVLTYDKAFDRYDIERVDV